MAGGGSIMITVPVKLNVVGLEELVKAKQMIEQLKKSAADIKIGTGSNKGGMSPKERNAINKTDKSLHHNQKRASNLSRTVSKDFLDLAKSTRTLISEMNKATNAMAKAGKRGGGSGGSGGGAGGGRSGGASGGSGSSPGGFFGSTARGDRSGGFGSRLKSVAEFGVAAKVFQAGVNTLAKIPETIVGVDAELKELNKVLATSGKNLENLRKAAVATGTEFGNSVTTVLKGFKVFAQQGLKQQEIVERGRAVSLAENVSTLSTDEAAETVTAGLKVFGDQVGGSAERLIDSFVAVESQNAVTAADLSEVVKRVGIAAKNAGTSFDELNAFTTVIQESTRAGGGRISRSLRFTFKNLFDQARQGDLQAVGVDTRTSGGELRDATDVLGDIAKKWNILTRAQKRNIAVNIGGTRFQNEFNALMEGFGKVSTVAAQSQGAAGTAAQRNAIIMQSLQKRAAKVGVAFEGLSSSIGGGVSAPVTAALTSAEKLLTVLTKISDTEFPGLKALQGAFGTAESEQTGTIGDIIGSTATSLAIGTVLAKGFGKALPATQGAFTKLISGAHVASIASGPLKGAAIRSGGAVGKLGGLFTKLPKVGPMISRFGVALAAAAPALTTFGGALLSILAPLAALAAIVGVATFAFNRLTESSEERDQRTGLNAERDFIKQRAQQLESLEKEVDAIEFQRQEIQKGNTQLSPEEQEKALKALQSRESKVQSDFRDVLVKSLDQEGRRGLASRLALREEQDEAGRDQFTRGNVPITGAAADLSKDSKQAQKTREQLHTAIRNGNKQSRKDLKEINLEKAVSSFGEQSFSAQATQFRSALDAAQNRGGLIGEGSFLNRISGGFLGSRGVTREERDVLLNPKLQDLTRQELNRDIKNPFLKAIREGGQEGFNQFAKNAAKLSEEGTLEFGTSRKDAQLRSLDALVENAVVKSGGKLSREEAASNIRGQFLESQGVDKDLVVNTTPAALAPILGPNLDALRNRGDAEVFQTQEFADFLQQRLGREAIGPEIKKITTGAVDALKASGGTAVDLSSRLRDRDGNLLEGKELNEALKSFKDTAVFRFKESGDVVTKIGDSLLKASDDGGADIVSGITDSGFIDALKTGSIELLSFNQKLQEAGSIAKNVALTGFGAGERLDIKDFQSGPTGLQDLSDQQAGAFVEIGKSGAVFNKGLQQFLNAARERQDELEEQQKGGTLEKEDQRELAAFSIIGKAAETFGIAAKSIESAARNMERFQRERSNREASPVSITEDQLFPGGFARLSLGRDQSELSPAERAQQALRPQALRLEELQFGAGQDQSTLNDIDEAGARLFDFVSSITADNVGTIDVDKLVGLFSKVEGFDTESAIENIKTQLEQIINRRAGDPTDSQAEAARGAIIGSLSKILTQSRKQVTDRIEQRRPEQLRLENLFKVESAFQAVAKASEDAEISFRNAAESAGGIDQALSTAFRSQGASASRLFTGQRGAKVDELSQVRGLERLNQFERARREARLLSSRAVQQGRVNVFDENRQRVAPISREEANARIQDSRLNERRAKAQERQQRQEQLFGARKGQLEQVLGQVRQVQRLDLGDSFKKAIDNVERSLVNVQQNRATSFFSRSGKFNDSAFNSLLNVSSNLREEFGKAVQDQAEVGNVSISEALAARDVLGDDLVKEIANKQIDKGTASKEDAKSLVAAGIMSKEEGAKVEEAINRQTYAPITSKLDVIASILSTIAAHMGATKENTDLKDAIEGKAKSEAAKGDSPSNRKGDSPKDRQGDSPSDRKPDSPSAGPTPTGGTPSPTSDKSASSEMAKKEQEGVKQVQEAAKARKQALTKQTNGYRSLISQDMLDNSENEVYTATSATTNRRKRREDNMSPRRLQHKLGSESKLIQSVSDAKNLPEELKNSMQESVKVLNSQRSTQATGAVGQGSTTELQRQAAAKRRAMFPNMQEGLENVFAARQPGAREGLETRTNKYGESIRGTTISPFEAKRMVDFATRSDSLTGGDELEKLKQRFGGSLPKGGEFMSLDANPFPGTGFSPFARPGKDRDGNDIAIPISGGEIFRDPEGTSQARGIGSSEGSRSDAAMSGVAQKMQQAAESVGRLAESSNRAANANDAKSQKQQTQQEENSQQLRKTAEATKESADLSHGRTTPANREQASRNNGSAEIDTAAIADAVRQGAAEGSREGTEQGAQAFERAAGNITVSLDDSAGGIGGRINSLEEMLMSVSQENESSIVALQSRQEQTEEALMSEISDVNTKVDTVDVRNQETQVALDAVGQRLNDNDSRINDVETAMADGAQPLEEANQRTEDNAAKVESALTQITQIQSRQEEHESHLASLEGRSTFFGD